MNQGRSSQRDPAERASSGILPRILRGLTAMVCRRPGLTLVIIGVITLGCFAWTTAFLKVKSNRADLIDPNAPFHQRWLRFVERFGSDADIVAVIEGENPQQIEPAIERLGSRIAAETKLFDRVFYRLDSGPLATKALQYLSPSNLQQIDSRLEILNPILNGHWERAGLEEYSRRLTEYLKASREAQDEGDVAAAIAQSQSLGESLSGFLKSPEDFSSPWPEILSADAFPDAGRFANTYQISESGRMGFILARPLEGESAISGESAWYSRLERFVEETRAEFPEVHIGLTGIPVLEADEMQRSQADMAAASILSFIGVAIVMLMGFRGIRHPVISMVLLTVGIAWALCFATLTVGHLNILSVSFAAILIGLGADYAVHYLSRYLELRQEGVGLVDALLETSGDVGSGILTAAMTGALAFFCATFTSFLGVAELGVIAAGGILLCAGLTFVMLPALIYYSDRNLDGQRLPIPFQGTMLRWVTSVRPRTITCVAFGVLLLVGGQAFTIQDGQLRSRIKYDYNLLNLQAKGIDSVEVQKRIFEETNGSLLYGISIAESPQQARLLREKFERLDTVARVEELASYLPRYPAAETNLLVQSIHSRLRNVPQELTASSPVNPQASGQALESLHKLLKDSPDAISQQAAAALDQALSALEHLDLERQMALLTGYQQAMLAALHGQFQLLATISHPSPMTADDFPSAMRARFVSPDGGWLVRVYPAEQVWDEEPLTRFVKSVRSVDPEMTGTPLQNFEAAGQIQASYIKAAFYALGAIILILLIDVLSTPALILSAIAPLAPFSIYMLTSPASTVSPVWLAVGYLALGVTVATILDPPGVMRMLLSLLPPVGGLFLTFGVLQICGLDLNPANLIVLPLILGLGVDNGVLLIHGFRKQRGRYQASPSTINAVLINSVTTIIGFASMLVAAHQGLVSLGLVLVIGITSCMIVSVGLLPSLLTWISLGRREEPEEPSGSADDDSAPLRVIPLPVSRDAA